MSLHQAVRDGNLALAKNLIVSGAEINAQDTSKRTALHLACWKADPAMVRLLLDFSADVRVKAQDNFTCIHFAAQQSSDECIRLLAKKDKTLVNATISKGNKTPLHLAAGKGQSLAVIRALVELGSDVSQKTNGGQSASDLTKNEEIFKYLQHTGKKRKETSPEGGDEDASGTPNETVASDIAVSTGAIDTQVEATKLSHEGSKQVTDPEPDEGADNQPAKRRKPAGGGVKLSHLEDEDF
jgi:hypothetical protein